MKTMLQKLFVSAACSFIATNKDASKLWNWIDHRSNPEPLWAIMQVKTPWAFRDVDNANSIHFTD